MYRNGSKPPLNPLQRRGLLSLRFMLLPFGEVGWGLGEALRGFGRASGDF